jgi:Skp family chaperone for outer membrane proteins
MMKLFGGSATAVVVLALCVVVESAAAQNPAGPPPMRAAAAPTIAMVDVGSIFNKHARFQRMVDEMKADYARARTEAKAEYEAIAQLNKGLQEYHAGTPEYKAREAQIAKRQADLAARMELEGKDFKRREASIYYGVYKDICDATNYYAQQHGIDIVLQFSGETVDPEQLESVGKFIARPVVAHRNDIDITPAILQSVNRGEPSGASRAPQPQGPARQ